MIRTLFTSLLICFSFLSGSAQNDYTRGVLVPNEGWFGHCNSSINFLNADGSWVYNVLQKENPNVQLGSTVSYATIYGDRLYVITKQDKDSGTDKEGARITVCDARTMKVIKQIKDIANDGTRADGRSFMAVNNDKAYVGTNNGIYVLDLNSLEIKGRIEGTENEHTDPYGRLYMGQTGTMIRVNEKVYALHQDRGLLIIDPETDKIAGVISGPDNGELTYGSAVLSKDGNLWMSVSDRYSRGDSYAYIMKYSPSTGDTLRVNMPEGISSPSNSWFAWTPDGFCASTHNNVLYWNTGDNTWYTCNKICSYDIDGNKFSQFLNFKDEGLKVYGASMRIDPVSDNLYVTLYEDPAKPYFVMRRYDNNGKMISEHEMTKDYWFPSIPVFPDNASPVANDIAATNITDSRTHVISLDDIASDADNMSAAMVKTITGITDENIVSASISNGNMSVTPLKDGSTNVNVNICSNGKNTSASIAISVTGYNGIDDAVAEIRSAYVAEGMLHINNCEGTTFCLYNAGGMMVGSFTASSQVYVRDIDFPEGMYVLSGMSEGKKIIFKLSIR